MQNIHYIGIDVSHLTLDINKLANEVEECKVLPNTTNAISEWITSLPANAHCVFEATGIYSHRLEYLLSEKHLPFTKVNPIKIKGYKMAGGSLNKSDAHDARYIRLYAQSFKVQPSRAVNEEQIKKDRYLHALSDLKKQLQNINNQIHVIQNESFLIEDLLYTYQHLKLTIEEQIQNLEQQLEVAKPVEEQTLIKLLTSIPGIGVKSAQVMLNAIDSFDYFDTDKQLAKFLGLAPVTATSGTSVKKTYGICNTAVPQVRSTLYMAATAAARYNPACKELRLKLRQKGKPKKVVRIAIVHKLIRQAFAIVKSGKKFDPKYETNRNDAKTPLENDTKP